jgi:hypothetical protein
MDNGRGIDFRNAFQNPDLEFIASGFPPACSRVIAARATRQGLFTDHCVICRSNDAFPDHPGGFFAGMARAFVRPMTEHIIVMPGPACFDLGAVHIAAQVFGWTVEIADDLREVTAAQVYGRTTAILFHRAAFGTCSWLKAVRLLRLALPEVRPLLCHGFSEPIDWPVLQDAGAFDALWLPLKENELRRSLGFVWEAEQRRVKLARRVSAAQRIAPALARDVRARVMASAAG